MAFIYIVVCYMSNAGLDFKFAYSLITSKSILAPDYPITCSKNESKQPAP